MSAAPTPTTADVPQTLRDKIVVITGGGQGIGRAYARRVAAAGGTALIGDIDTAAAARVASEIEADGGRAVATPLDVGDPESCAAAAESWLAAHGRVDGLVNNAAIFSTITMKPFWEIPVAEWDRLMAVNLRGPWLVTSALLPALRAARSASVVNVASDAVWLGRGGYLHYVASKAGVAGMSHAMAHELGGDDIRVNTVSPGPIDTEIERATVSPEQKAAMQAAQSLHRDGTPDDVVGAVAFLLSDDSAYISGQTLHINGGLLHR